MKPAAIIQIAGCLVLMSTLLLATVSARASEKELIDLGKAHTRKGEYYSAVTEMMRYQHLHPSGIYYPTSLLVMGEAYFRGGNYYAATASISQCYERFRDRPEGEKALFLLGYIRLVSGSVYYARRTYQEYNYIYPRGLYAEETAVDLCYTQALMDDLEGARASIREYRQNFPRGKYAEDLLSLETEIRKETEKPLKNPWISITGSVFLPGFGHFYTEKYSMGFITLGINATLIYLIYDGVRDRDKFRIIFFSLVEIPFYQYSLFSSVHNVHEYNSRERFYEHVRLGIKSRF